MIDKSAKPISTTADATSHGNSPGYGFAEVRTAIVVPGNPTIYTRQLISPWGVVATDVTGGGGGCGLTRWCN